LYSARVPIFKSDTYQLRMGKNGHVVANLQDGMWSKSGFCGTYLVRLFGSPMNKTTADAAIGECIVKSETSFGHSDAIRRGA